MDGGSDAGQRTLDAGGDAGPALDAGSDAGSFVDAGADAGSAVDAGLDAGPPLLDAGSIVTAYACPAGAAEVVVVGEVPPPATLAPYAAFSATLSLANCGSQTWTASEVSAPGGFKLGFDAPRDDDTWGMGRIALPADVPPGMQVTLSIEGRATPLTGPHAYRWSVVHEGVAWLSGPSPLHTITVSASPMLAMHCPGVQADIGGGASASAQVQQCIDATPSGGTLELPAGLYRMSTALQFTHPMLLRTAGTAGVGAGCLDPASPPCAVFRADDNLDVPRGFVRFGPTSGVTLEHVILDGNREVRLASSAASQCASGNNGAGFNAATGGCVGCSFVQGVSARALCGTGWEWSGDQATIRGCVFRDNGDHTTTNMWSDGLTLTQSSAALVSGNRFVDDSDVDLIFGGGTQAQLHDNLVTHLRQASFAGLMLDNFNGGTTGDFTGTLVSANTILCGVQLCDFAIELGPHPWYPSANLIGGTVQGNVAQGGKFNINVEGAGTASVPMVVTGNSFGTSPASAGFNCGARSSTAFNVSPDSFVDLGSGPSATGSITFHGCP